MGDDTNPNSVIEEIMESPKKLRDLDLDAFAEELGRQVCIFVHVDVYLCACTFKNVVYAPLESIATVQYFIVTMCSCQVQQIVTNYVSTI